MTDEAIAEKLVIEITTKLDESEYLDFKNELQNNKEQTLKITPQIDASSLKELPDQIAENYKINEDKAREFIAKKREERKNAPQSPQAPPESIMSLQNLMMSDIKKAKDFLTKVSSSSDSDLVKYPLRKEKANEYLAEILKVEKKSANSLENLLSKQEAEKNKLSTQSDGGGSGLGLIGGIAAAIAAVIGSTYLIAKEIQQKYMEKIGRELGLANLAKESGMTADSMAKLNYQAKNVGLSLDQVVHNAQNFTEDIFTGQNEQKNMMFAVLGVNPFEKLRNIKTPEDAQKYQLEIFKESEKALEKAWPKFLATKKAAELAGIPQDQILSYENFGTNKNIGLAEKTKEIRGNLGTNQEIISNFEDVTASMQDLTASMDKLLSTEGIAKAISISTANIQATTVNLINATINGIIGNDKTNKELNKLNTKQTTDYINKSTGISHFAPTPSASAQTKAGI